MAPHSQIKWINRNHQGLEGPLIICHLKELCCAHSLDIVYLMETKNSDRFVRKKLSSYGYVDMLFVSPFGSSGGLVLVWKHHLLVLMERYFSFFIHVTFVDIAMTNTWSIVFMYASSIPKDHVE